MSKRLVVFAFLFAIPTVSMAELLQFQIDPSNSYLTVSQEVNYQGTPLTTVPTYPGSTTSALTGEINANIDFLLGTFAFANPSHMGVSDVNVVPAPLAQAGESVNFVGTTDFGNDILLVNAINDGVLDFVTSNSAIALTGIGSFAFSTNATMSLSFQYLDYFTGPSISSSASWYNLSSSQISSAIQDAMVERTNTWHWQLTLPFEIVYDRTITNFGSGYGFPATVTAEGYIVATAAIPEIRSSLLVGVAALMLGAVARRMGKLGNSSAAA